MPQYKDILFIRKLCFKECHFHTCFIPLHKFNTAFMYEYEICKFLSK